MGLRGLPRGHELVVVLRFQPGFHEELLEGRLALHRS